ncbi:MAG: hypothetical protein BM563_09010 [Bacteroidetes bacterium MedPE-SWsnd-G1]|nr:MAG: hypothetical protein BM563_09010 [Bacteroidetes bacterium MedPE-SWsnd-G1]
MKNLILLFVICFCSIFYSCDSKNNSLKTETENNLKEISFITSDSIKIYGDLYEKDKSSPIILLFHQGGSNARAEYDSIIPKLISQGFNVLAIDQRMGGQYYGGYNRTVAQIKDHIFGNPYSYCDAYNNLEGALNYVIESGFTGNKILWGSSYSASLAIKLGNNHQTDISGVLAFSPASGGSMKNCLPDPYFESLKIPLLILRPPNEMKSENSKTQFEKARRFGHQTYAAINGVHGSSMLVKERVGADTSKTWEVVNLFLAKFKND